VASRPRRLDPELLEVLTSPREAGTTAVARAREAVAAHLRALGYRIEIQAFRFDPSALRAFPLLGVGVAWMGLVLVPLLVSAAPPGWAALAAWLAGAALLGMLAYRVGSRRPVCSGHGGAVGGADLRDDANLLAVRSTDVRCWVVAHLDTKAQGHSMAGRLIAVWLVIIAALALSALALARIGGPQPLVDALAGAGAAVVAGVLAGRGRLRGQSPGVRDNGSGVVAALTAAASIRDPGVGFIITGAEEFGLMGARALARERADLFTGRTVVNLDTLDETGAVTIVSHDRPGRQGAEEYARRLRALGLPVRVRRLPLGILVDSLAFARTGARAITIARLDWSTLRRLHTPRDSAEGCSFETASRIGAAVVS